jgi:hypothetical protein
MRANKPLRERFVPLKQILRRNACFFRAMPRSFLQRERCRLNAPKAKQGEMARSCLFSFTG